MHDHSSPPQNQNTPDNMREALHRKILDGVSHDLKTPLATIIGSLEIYRRMEEKLSKEKCGALIGAALSEAYRLDNFITNILDMAKLENDMVRVRNEACDLTRLISECWVKLGPKRANCEMTMHSLNADTLVHADPMLLARAVNLVLENAMKHGGKKPVIVIEYGKEGGDVFIRVRDHGPGIAQGKETEIFSKYTRFHKADHQNAGTGLGLAICRQLMKLLAGTVEVANHAGGGAEFTIRLPAG